MRLYKLAWKHIVDGSYMCNNCTAPLTALDVIAGSHHFKWGQVYSCTCHESAIWTNSIRYPEALIQWCDGEEVSHQYDPTMYGFCNDIKCPFCWSNLMSLDSSYASDVTGSEWWINYYKKNIYDTDMVPIDLHGCINKSCGNKNMIFVPGKNLGEYEGQEATAQWYKAHQGLWRSKVASVV